MSVPGFRYLPDFIRADEERALLAELERLDLENVEMHGVIAKRTVAHFGLRYGYESWTLEAAPPLPSFLYPLRARCASLIDVAPEAFAEVLVSKYPAGASIGWHRDAPMFGPEIVSVSLGSAATLALRPRGQKKGSRRAAFSQTLEPRSAYVLGGESRVEWQHTLRPVRETRWSIAFRTLAKAAYSGA
jgi:DNA oxidative demethylase